MFTTALQKPNVEATLLKKIYIRRIILFNGKAREASQTLYKIFIVYQLMYPLGLL